MRESICLNQAWSFHGPTGTVETVDVPHTWNAVDPLIIGAVHICIAMTVKAVGQTVRFGFKESLSAWGWLLLVDRKSTRLNSSHRL